MKGNQLWSSYLGNRMDRGAWWAVAHGLQKNWTQLSDWTTTIRCQIKPFLEYKPFFFFFKFWLPWAKLTFLGGKQSHSRQSIKAVRSSKPKHVTEVSIWGWALGSSRLRFLNCMVITRWDSTGSPTFSVFMLMMITSEKKNKSVMFIKSPSL